MISREEFKLVAKSWHNQYDYSNDDSPLWYPEFNAGIKSEWFAFVKPLPLRPEPFDEREKYYQWCDDNMESMPLCYSSSDITGEWWGFVDKDEAILWLLKWA